MVSQRKKQGCAISLYAFLGACIGEILATGCQVKGKLINKMLDKNTIGYGLAASFGAVCSFLGIDPIVIWILLLAFVLDLVTGILKAYITGEYTSKIGWVKTLTKVMGLGLVGLVALIFKVLGGDHKPFLYASIMVLAVHDAISTSSNIYTARTGKKLPEIDAVSLLIKSINTQLVKLVKKILNVKDDEG